MNFNVRPLPQSLVNRRNKRKLEEAAAADRAARIASLLALGWIADAAEIPTDAIPVDPKRLTLCGWSPPTFYRDLDFTCKDCGVPQTWAAEDQRWYFETTGAPYVHTARRCRSCRKKEQQRKTIARIGAGHAKPTAQPP